jgi:hypothetical protein
MPWEEAEETEPTLSADGIREVPLNLEGGLSGTDNWAGYVIIWVFVAVFFNEFILGLDILHTYDAYVNLGRHMLRFWEEELLLSSSLAIAPVFPPCIGKGPKGIGTMRGSSDDPTLDTLPSKGRPDRAESGGPRSYGPGPG